MNQPNPFDPPQSFAQQGATPPPASYLAPGQGQPPHPGQPQPPVPPQPPRKSWFARHKILTGLGALVVVGVVAGIAGGGGDGDGDAAPAPSTSATDAPAEATEAPAEATSETAAEAPAESAPGIGSAVRDGKFEFTVTGVEAGVPMIGNDMLGETAQGQFVLVSVTVANIGNEAQSFFGDNATLVDDQGREHSADSTAALYLENSESFYTEINPGNAVDAVVVFDVPTDAVPTAIELHDSLFSGGVTVTLQ